MSSRAAFARDLKSDRTIYAATGNNDTATANPPILLSTKEKGPHFVGLVIYAIRQLTFTDGLFRGWKSELSQAFPESSCWDCQGWLRRGSYRSARSDSVSQRAALPASDSGLSLPAQDSPHLVAASPRPA